MLNTHDHIVQVTTRFLRLLKVKVASSTVNETLQNHPDFPSLLCVSDALHKWNIPHGATRICNKQQLDELPTPFLAGFNKSEIPFVVVKDIHEKKVDLFYDDQSALQSLKREEFTHLWNGVCLIAEPNEESGEKNYVQNKRKELFRTGIVAALFILGISLSFLYLRHTIRAAPIASSIPVYIMYAIMLAGVAVSSLLLWYEIDKNNPLLQKVCTGITKGNCSAILSAKAAKITGWLSWSEVGFFYFTGGLLSVIFIPYSPIPYLLNLLAIPYILFSVYYQWRVARQWCVLCLAVQFLLLLGGINALYNNLYEFRGAFSVLPLAIYLLLVLLWFNIRPYIIKQQQGIQLKRDFLRIKFNTEIFDTLLKKQKQFSLPVDGLGIDIGNPSAEHQIIKICNPYCGPCAKAHPMIEKLLHENDNLKVKIIFTAPNNPEQAAYKPVAHLLAIAAQKNEAVIKQALDDWYLAEKKDYDAFAARFPMNGELKMQERKIERMSNWCKETDIQFTPTIFFNGYQLPDAYTIEDIAYFLQK